MNSQDLREQTERQQSQIQSHVSDSVDGDHGERGTTVSQNILGGEEHDERAATPPASNHSEDDRGKKLIASQLEPEDEFDDSSPSDSGFIISPAAKPQTCQNTKAKIFSDDDEIQLLQGLEEFWENGVDNRWTEFYLFIKDQLRHPFTKTQVSEKIRRLKEKFERNAEKARKNGGAVDLADSHQSRLFERSRRLWGDNEGRQERKRERGKSIVLYSGERADEEEARRRTRKRKRQRRRDEIPKEDFESEFLYLTASFEDFKYPLFVKDNCYLIGRKKALMLEDQWRELNNLRARLELKKIYLVYKDKTRQISSNSK